MTDAEWLPVWEVAFLLQIPEATVLRRIGRGDIVARRTPAGAWRIPRLELQRWLRVADHAGEARAHPDR